MNSKSEKNLICFDTAYSLTAYETGSLHIFQEGKLLDGYFDKLSPGMEGDAFPELTLLSMKIVSMKEGTLAMSRSRSKKWKALVLLVIVKDSSVVLMP